jgi:hypothetical protein
VVSHKKDWLVVLTILKNMKVSWNYYCQCMEKLEKHVPNHQLAEYSYGSWQFIPDLYKVGSYMVAQKQLATKRIC